MYRQTDVFKSNIIFKKNGHNQIQVENDKKREKKSLKTSEGGYPQNKFQIFFIPKIFLHTKAI